MESSASDPSEKLELSPPAVSDAVAGAPSFAEPPPLLPPPPPPALEPARFNFTGDAREYFRIWIVNALLSILTLGFFAAWAKVRKRRYLRGNTEFLGHRFDYTASPWRLLIVNLIIVSLFLAYVLFGAVYPAVRIGALIVFLIFLPWIVVRSLAFNAHHTVYRGMRFRFHRSLSAAVMLYFLRPLLLLVTFGFYFPAWARHRQEFIVGRHRLGTAPFRLELRSGPFFGIYFIGGGMVFIGAVIIGVTTAFLFKGNAGHVPTPAQLWPILLIYGAAAYVAKHYVFAEVFKLVWNKTRLDEHRFRTRLHTDRWVGLQVVNLLAIVATCGLAYPWAVVRSSRYALSSLELHLTGPLETIASMEAVDGSAIGDTAAEFAGLDFGL